MKGKFERNQCRRVRKRRGWWWDCLDRKKRKKRERSWWFISFRFCSYNIRWRCWETIRQWLGGKWRVQQQQQQQQQLRGLEKEKRLSFSFQRVYTTTRESKEITIYYDIYILLDWMLQSFFSLIFLFFYPWPVILLWIAINGVDI